MKSQSIIITEDSVYHCPICNSKRIIEISQNVLLKGRNVNTGVKLNPNTYKRITSNREKAYFYDTASLDGVGCWHYECLRCHWESKIYTE